MLLLRQLAATGLTMLLLPAWRRRHPLALGPSPTGAGASNAPAGSAPADAMEADAHDIAAQAAAPPPPAVDPAAVAAAAAALRAHVAAEGAGAFGASLFRQLAHGHPLLGAEGAQQRSARSAALVAGGWAGLGRGRPALQCVGPCELRHMPAPHRPTAAHRRPACRPPSLQKCRQLLGMSRDDMMIKMVTKTMTRWVGFTESRVFTEPNQ